MKTRTMTPSTAKSEELTQAPHVLAQLVDLLDGTLQPTPEREAEIATHLAGCTSCQLFVELSLLAIIKDEQERDRSAREAQTLLARWSNITHITCKAELPVYVEIQLEQGEQVAKGRFPMLANHLPTCPDCQAEARDLRSWLDL